MIEGIRGLTRLHWPPLDYELGDAASLGYFKGVVLNAGAGWRDISHLIAGELVQQDISIDDYGNIGNDTRVPIDIYSPLDSIPRDDETFDAIICTAVLEHVINPVECVREMHRVIKRGGHIVVSVPFLQPEHKIPTDYQRYTKDGLIQLLEHNGFIVDSVLSLFSVYHTIHWIVEEWLRIKNTIVYKFLRVILLVPLAHMAHRSKLTDDKIASAFRVIAHRP